MRGLREVPTVMSVFNRMVSFVERKLYPQATRYRNFYTGALLAVMLGVAFVQGYRTTYDLTWPDGPGDTFREITFAQNIVDGHFGNDPTYLHEYIWYNPLCSATIAAISEISGLSVPVVATRAPAYLNLLAPLAFFFMLVVLFDRIVALCATGGFLFYVNHGLPGFASATYSPWIFPTLLVQTVFYLAIAVCFVRFQKPGQRWHSILLGALIGVAFLGDATPTILLLAIVGVLLIREAIQTTPDGSSTVTIVRTVLSSSILIVIPMVLISLPFTWFIVGKYHLHFLNREINRWQYVLASPHGLPSLAKRSITLSFMVAVAGFVTFVRKRSESLRKWILLVWPITAVVCWIYVTATLVLDKYGLHLPGLVPPHHFLFYLKGSEAVFFGFGVVTVTSPAVAYVIRRLKATVGRLTQRRLANVVAIAVVLVSVAASFPQYERWDDFQYSRNEAHGFMNDHDVLRAYHWIRAHTPWDAVFVSPDKFTQFPVAVAGRKLIAMTVWQSNPYVSFPRRLAARTSFLEALHNEDTTTVAAIASAYEVTHIITDDELLKTHLERMPRFVTLAFESNALTIWQLNRSGLGQPVTFRFQGSPVSDRTNPNIVLFASHWVRHHTYTGYVAPDGSFLRDGMDTTWVNYDLVSTRQWHNDMLDGTETAYYPNGKTEWSGSYDSGRRTGWWEFYNRAGKESYVAVYTEDRLVESHPVQ